MNKVMIVDDDSTSVAIGKAFLDDAYEVAIARSGLQALGALQSEVLPDLILLDMLMPGISGMEVLSTIKKDSRLKEIPVIFLTSEKSPELEIEGYTNGAADFLQKPVNRMLLRIKIEQQLAYTSLRREHTALKSKANQL